MKSEFGDQKSFLLSEDKKPEVVVATANLTLTSFYHDPDRIISKAAKIIRTEIQDKFRDNPLPTWSPSTEQLNSEVFRPPTNLLKLIETILTTSTNRASRSKKIGRLTKSISQDIVFNCLQGKVLQSKHLLIGLGLHNLTGSRKVLDMLSKLEYCINHNMVCDIETSQAEIVQEEASSKSVLPFHPIAAESI